MSIHSLTYTLPYSPSTRGFRDTAPLHKTRYPPCRVSDSIYLTETNLRWDVKDHQVGGSTPPSWCYRNTLGHHAFSSPLRRTTKIITRLLTLRLILQLNVGRLEPRQPPALSTTKGCARTADVALEGPRQYPIADVMILTSPPISSASLTFRVIRRVIVQPRWWCGKAEQPRYYRGAGTRLS